MARAGDASGGAIRRLQHRDLIATLSEHGRRSSASGAPVPELMGSSNRGQQRKQFRSGSYAGCRVVFAVGMSRRIMGLRERSLPVWTPHFAVAAVHPIKRNGPAHVPVSCPRPSGPSTMTVWITEGTTNAEQEAQA
jgi:hypothetical protein